MIEKYLKQPKCFRNENGKIFWLWKEQVPHIVTSTEEWNSLLAEAEKNYTKINPLNKAIGSHQYFNECYFIAKAKETKYISLYVASQLKIACFITNQTYLCAEDSTELEASYEEELRSSGKKGVGTEAYENINAMFQEIWQVKSSIYELFSGWEYASQYIKIKRCVPHQIAYITSVTGREITNVYKADVSSAFPYQLTKKVPTLHGCKVLQGTVKPTKEYPFAFYVNSHHMSIYNELDTRKDAKSYYMKDCIEIYNDVELEQDETILCKASKYNFKEIINTLYKQKKSKNEKLSARAKLTMNGFIGFCQFNKNPRLSMISAAVIARSNHYILDKVEYLTKEGNKIRYIATDSIVWSGSYSECATHTKKLGAFVYELEDGSFFGRAVGSYQLKKDDVVLTKCSYITNDKKKDIKFGELPLPKNTQMFIGATGKIYEV